MAPERPAVPVRVLVMAWGPSVHAERRIRVFADDPGFSVLVVSPHDFRIPGARTVRLMDGDARRALAERLAGAQEREAALRRDGGVSARVAGVARRAAEYARAGRLLWTIGVRDPALLRRAMASFETVLEIAAGTEDFGTLSSAVREFGPDVVLLQTLLHPCYLAYYLPRRIPRVVTIWNGDATWWAEWTGVERLLKKGIVAHGLRTAAAVTVNSAAVLKTCLGLGAREESVHLIRYPGVDLSRFRPGDKGRARKALGIGAKRVVLCPRGLGGYLNSDVIVEATAAVVRRFPETLFLFLSGVGGERAWESHLDRARGLGTAENCRWDGQVPWDAMPAYYQAADAMVSVSSRDSLPNCMLEAMACGVPVVMGDIEATREWVEDGVNGHLVDPRDPGELAARIVGLLDDPAGRGAAFAERNILCVRRDADAARGAERIRDLVRGIAARGRGGKGP